MMGVVDYLFGAASFVPHGYCLLWRPDLVALHAASDFLIAAAYFSIPAALFVLQQRRKDIAYPWMFRLFAAFILACGLTHVIGLWTLWHSVYGLQALVKAMTAGISVATAILLWPLLPKALALPSPAALRAANDRLEAEIARRTDVEMALREAWQELETRVQARTRELVATNDRLADESAQRQRTTDELRAALHRLHQHMTNTPLAVIELEFTDVAVSDGRIRLWSGQAEAIFGWTDEEVAGRSLDELALVHESDHQKQEVVVQDLASGRKTAATTSLRCATRSRELRYCRCYVSIVRDATAAPTVLILVEDVTDRVLAEERIHRLAHHDPLTGLPNRLLFRDRLEQALSQARWENRRLAVLLLDLDHFKEVNDTLGHAAGDQLLRLVTTRLMAAVPRNDAWARLGGDEFALIQSGLIDPDEAEVIARRILRALEPSMSIEGQEITVSASLGVTLFPEDADTADQLLRNVDMALYQAKAAGRRTFELYRSDMDREMRASRSLQRLIRDALDRDEFRLLYQPIVDLATGELVQVEALLRLDHPDGGPVPPSIVVPVAEVSGLIHGLGRWVIERACRDAADWEARGRPIKVAVNLSPAQLRHQDFVATVERALERHRLAPALLEFELTESIFVDPSKQVIVSALETLAAFGVTLALDDFGTGYSSLGYLKHFPLHTIKIDGSFVRDIGQNRGGEKIVLAIIALARSLGKQTVAECIESDVQLSFLIEHGCALGQGFGLARPMPGTDLLRQVLPWGPLLARPRAIPASYRTMA